MRSTLALYEAICSGVASGLGGVVNWLTAVAAVNWRAPSLRAMVVTPSDCENRTSVRPEAPCLVLITTTPLAARAP